MVGLGRRHTSVINQYIQPLALPQKFPNPLPHRLKLAQIHPNHLDPPRPLAHSQYIFPHLRPPSQIPNLHEDFRAGRMQRAHGFDADARGGAGYEHDFVWELVDEVFVVDDLEGCGAGVAGAAGVSVDGAVRVRWGRHLSAYEGVGLKGRVCSSFQVPWSDEVPTYMHTRSWEVEVSVRRHGCKVLVCINSDRER